MVVAVEEVHVVAGVVVERPGVGAEAVLQPFHNKGAVERAEVLPVEELGCPSKNLQGVVALLRLVLSWAGQGTVPVETKSLYCEVSRVTGSLSRRSGSQALRVKLKLIDSDAAGGPPRRPQKGKCGGPPNQARCCREHTAPKHKTCMASNMSARSGLAAGLKTTRAASAVKFKDARSLSRLQIFPCCQYCRA